ncbi:MAG: T9SS type A sorting domain-containing protein [Lewinellaceae bacterium]|nr:T9SS type A sorting domain-containing protein [Lewinellaceae bacterium]
MKRLTFFCLLVAGFTLPTTAQITITNSVFPAVGDTLHYHFGNQPGAINQIFTPPGGGQVWDLGNLQATQTWNQVMKNPATGMKSASFPSASVLFNPLNSSAEVYWQVTGNQILDLGYYGLDPLGLGLTLLFKKLPGLEQSWAPINFFDIHQSSSNVLTAFDAPLAPPVLLNLVPTADSFRIRITYQRLGSVDAYGTLTIPGGSFDVLRKKQTEYKSSAVDVKVAPLGWIDISTIGGQQVLPLGTDTITTFHFLNDLSKEAIAICTLNTAQNMVTGVQYKNLSTPSATYTPALNTEMVTYPNPVHNTLYVHFTNETGATYQFQLLNAQGRLILEQTVAKSETLRDIALPVANLAPGIYTLILQRNGIPVDQSTVVKF